jgi:ATP-binding cassette subfamily B protein
MSAGTGSEPDPARRRGSTLRRAIRLAWRASRGEVVLLLIVATVSGVVAPAAIWISEYLVNLVAGDGRPAGAGQWVPATILLGLSIPAQRILQAIGSNHERKLVEAVNSTAELDFLRATSRADISFIENPAGRDRIAQAGLALGGRMAGVVQSLFHLECAVITCGTMLAILFSVNPLLILLVAALLAASIPYNRVQAAALTRLFTTSTPLDRERFYLRILLAEAQPAKEVRAYALAPHLLQRYRSLSDGWLREVIALVSRLDRYAVVSGLFSVLIATGACLVIVSQAVTGSIKPGGVAAMIGVFAGFSGQLTGVSASLASLGESSAYLTTFFGFLDSKTDIVPARNPPLTLPEDSCGGIEFDGVHFTYPGADRPALAGLSFRIGRGESLSLVGANGAGKTTIVKLLLRLYDPDAGHIYLGGVDIRDLDPAGLRDRIGVLFQDFTTFHFTIRENVSFGRTAADPSDAGIEQALDVAGAAKVVSELPAGTGTHLGQLLRGAHDLSGGELQRIALARLVFRSPQVWVLDEPTSAFDAAAESRTLLRIKTLLAGRMGIIISHRFSTIRLADRIVVIEQGRVTESGTHDELLARDGRYAELFHCQAAGYT